MASIGNRTKPKDSVEMKANTFGLLRAYLAKRGYPQSWIEESIGGTPSGRSRLDIISDLKGALKDEV